MKERVYAFNERAERSVVDRMRDLDEIIADAKSLYPDNTWSRADFLLLFFLDDIGDGIQKLANHEADGWEE